MVDYVEILYIDKATDNLAWQLCKSRLDKACSLVDCTSFIVMQQLEILETLTTDHHFEQAGFIRLLK
jgi:predicted nucleic acid-binding protein